MDLVERFPEGLDAVDQYCTCGESYIDITNYYLDTGEGHHCEDYDD